MRKTVLLAASLAALALAPSPATRAAEAPGYTLVAELDAGIEVRDDAPRLMAEVVVEDKDFGRAGALGLRRLAAYLAGANDRRERIGRTTPVTQGARPQGWVVGVVMPEHFTAATLPRPTDTGIRIVAVRQRHVAAIRFGGRWTPIRHAEHWRLLKRELDMAGWVATGEPVAAQYDAPWVPGPLRRNEVRVPVQRRR